MLASRTFPASLLVLMAVVLASCAPKRADLPAGSKGRDRAEPASTAAPERNERASRANVSDSDELDHEDFASAPTEGRRSAPPPSPPASLVAKHALSGAPATGMVLQPEASREAYAHVSETGFRRAVDAPLSTFSIDVDTASYSNVRRFLEAGAMPPPGAVRIEELVNYFRFDDPEPKGDDPFSATTEVADCPWAPGHRLVRIGLKGRSMDEREVPARNLVFLVDVSGSMASPDKLPLVQAGLSLLAERLRPEDRVAIVVYAGAAGLVLEPTSDRGAVLEALARLQAGGSTNGGEGIQLAYDLARRSFRKAGVNRVILATDGDFNVGTTSQDALVRLIEEEREHGIFLTVLGFGTGNLQDATMEALADKGNGNFAYVDSLDEARKILVREAGSTLVTIAKDVKIQVEWNPATVEAYRLVGYENRALAAEDFNDDRKDAGEIGAGHSVTALYEVVPRGGAVPAASVDPLRYQKPALTAASASGDLMTLKLRWKQPDGDESELLEVGVRDGGRSLEAASDDLRFSAAVAAWGMLLRGSAHAGSASLSEVIDLAENALGDDEHGDRADFVRLARLSRDLSPPQVAVTR